MLADDPSLTVRDFDIGRQPLRVVVDGHLSMRAETRLLRLPGKTLVVTGEDDDDYAVPLLVAGAEVLVLPAGPGQVDLAALMQDLAQREVNELLVEAGATVCGALLKAGLVDELVIYMAPHCSAAARAACSTSRVWRPWPTASHSRSVTCARSVRTGGSLRK